MLRGCRAGGRFRLRRQGHHVVAVSRRADADRWLADEGASPVRLDLFDTDAATALATQVGAEAVVNLATHATLTQQAAGARW